MHTVRERHGSSLSRMESAVLSLNEPHYVALKRGNLMISLVSNRYEASLYVVSING